jgi:molybdate transport system substrate-binding protein
MGPRRGNSNPASLAAIAGVALLVVCILLLLRPDRSDGSSAAGGSLRVHCAAGVRAPVEELARAFEARTGTRVELSYGGSGTLLAGVLAGGKGDLFIAGDASFVDRAHEQGALRERLALSSMRAVLGVARGNPHNVRGLADLAREDLRVGLGNPEAAAVGRLARAVLTETGSWEEVRGGLKVQKPTVNELAGDLDLGALDVAVVWDATLASYGSLEAVRCEALEAQPRQVTVGVLEVCSAPARALAFARFMASSDVGAPVFRAHGFTPTGGDVFIERPRIVLMSGAMLRPAVQETLHSFEEREGVSIETVYNGCGILVAQMKTGELPDAYLSCDLSFLDLVQAEFEASMPLASNPMVILVQPGNPSGIVTLAHLSRPGLRVGLAHPEKSALGALTRQLLDAEGELEAIHDSGNLKVESPTGDLLVNQLRAGSLDATIVYASNAALAGEEAQAIALDLDGALAVQPFAIQRDSASKDLLQRLLDQLLSTESRRRFEELDFRWLGKEEG